MTAISTSYINVNNEIQCTGFDYKFCTDEPIEIGIGYVSNCRLSHQRKCKSQRCILTYVAHRVIRTSQSFDADRDGEESTVETLATLGHVRWTRLVWREFTSTADPHSTGGRRSEKKIIQT
jgi:hypothetical protein